MASDPFAGLMYDDPNMTNERTTLTPIGDTVTINEEEKFEARREELLDLAREETDRFVSTASPMSPEEDRGGDTSSEGSDDKNSSDDALEKLPPGFAFPVTKKIIHFLNRFSSSSQASFPYSSSSGSLSVDGSTDGGQQDITASTTVKGSAPTSATASRGIKQSYSQLIQNLRDPKAVDILSSIKVFVGKFMSERSNEEPPMDLASLDLFSWDAEEMPGENNKEAVQVRGFLRKLEAQVKVHPLWKGLNEEDWMKTVESLEKFIMLKIEKRAFQPTAKDKYLDMKLRQRINSLSFLRPDHLEVKRASREESCSKWEQAGKELSNMNKFRSPRDKVVCILNCCRLITSILREEADPSVPQVGADDFVPSLIYVVLKSNPQNLHSNLEYIAAYRRPAALAGEAGYFFTQLASAVSFIQRLEAGLLSISESEFIKGLKLCQDKLETDPNFSFGWEGYQPTNEMGFPEVAREDQAINFQEPAIMSRKDKEEASLLPTDAEERESWKSKRFRFVGREIGDLRIDELPQLMEEYKTLAATVDGLLLE